MCSTIKILMRLNYYLSTPDMPVPEYLQHLGGVSSGGHQYQVFNDYFSSTDLTD